MAKLSKEQQAYMDAYARIVSVANEKGAEEAIKEARRRCITGTPPHIDKKAEIEFCEKCKSTILDTILIMTMVVLHDEFGYGRKRLNRFKARFNLKSLCLAEDEEVNWQMMQDILLEECNIATEIKWALGGKDPTEKGGK